MTTTIPTERTTTPVGALAVHARPNEGVFTLADARAHGVSRKVLARLIRDGTVERVHHTVYRFTAVAVTWGSLLRAAVSAAGPDAVASHRAAARWLGIPDVPWVRPELVVAGKHLRIPGVTVHRTRNLPEEDVTVQRGLRITTGSRTLIDLAAVLERVQLVTAADGALCARITTRGRLYERALQLAPGRAGVHRLVAITEPGADGVFWSALERRFGALIRASRLPQPVYNARLVHRGATYYADALWEERLVVTELQSLRFHDTPGRRGRDDERRNAFAEMGIRLLVAGWADVHENPEAVVSTIAGTLAVAAA
jgi:hypothetical protein